MTIDPLYDADLDGPMTPKAFTARALSMSAPAGGQKAFGPLVVVLLPIVLGTVVGWLVTKILDAIWEHMVQGRTRVARGILRVAYVRPAIRQAAESEGATLTDDEWGELEEAAMTGIVNAARSLSVTEFESLKEGAAA